MLLFLREALLRCLAELAEFPPVSNISYPLFQLLINMSEAVEPAVPDEEVLLEVFDHPFNFPLGPGPAWTTGPWQEAVVISKQQEPGVEHHLPVVIFQHSGFLVIDQHGFHATTEVAEGANQGLVGMLCILLWCGKDMEATGVPQCVNREVNFASLSGHFNLYFAPVMLQLVTWLGFEANRLLRWPHFTFGLDVVTQHGTSTGITQRLDFIEYDLAVPDIFSQSHVDIVHKRLQLGHFMACFPGWRLWIFKQASDCSLRTSDLTGYIDNINALLAHLLYHVKVLSAQHVDILLVWEPEGNNMLGGADNLNGELLSYIIGADTQTAPSTEPVAELPDEVADAVQAISATLAEQLAKLAAELNDKVVKAAERRIDDITRAAEEQQAETEQELADAAQTVDDLEQKLEEMTADFRKTQELLDNSREREQVNLVELAQVRERLAATEDRLKASEAAAEQHRQQQAELQKRLDAAGNNLAEVMTHHETELRDIREQHARNEADMQKRLDEAGKEAVAEQKKQQTALDQALREAAAARESKAELNGELKSLKEQNRELTALLAGKTEPAAAKVKKGSRNPA